MGLESLAMPILNAGMRLINIVMMLVFRALLFGIRLLVKSR